MKNILIPMDFTSVAMNAFMYASDLFKNDNLHVIHSTPNTGKNPEFIGAKPGQTKSEFLKIELESWIKHQLNISELPSNVSITIAKGDPFEAIKDTTRENFFDYILMGTRDNYTLFDKWLGTISLSVIKTIDVPTYLIPRYARYDGFDKIIIGSDSHIGDEGILEGIAKWNKEHQAFLSFLNINNYDNEEFNAQSDLVVQKYYEQMNTKFGFEIDSISDTSIYKTLLARAYNKQANLILLLPQKQSLLNSLLFKSISKEMILSSKIPMLFFKPNKSSQAEKLNQEETSEI